MAKVKITNSLKTNYNNTAYRIERREQPDPRQKGKILKAYWLYENEKLIDDYDHFGETVYQMLIRAGQINAPEQFFLTPQ